MDGEHDKFIMKNYLRNIKILFVAFIALVVFGVSSSILLIKNTDFFTVRQAVQTISYLNYKLAFAQTSNESLAAATALSVGDTSVVAVNTNDRAKSVPVLLYHGIIDHPDGSNILLKDFEEQMFGLKKSGWQTVSIEDFREFMKGEKELPAKSFLLTFDDGRKDSYYPVDPILRALDYRAVMFVDTQHSINLGGNGYYLSPKEIEGMLKSKRWEVQSHSRMAHSLYPINKEGVLGTFLGNKLWLEDKERVETDKEFRERIGADLAGSKSDIYNTFDVNASSFAYPFGDFGRDSINFPNAENIVLAAARSVYEMSFYQAWTRRTFTSNYPGNSFLMKRVSVRPYWNSNNLLKVLSVAEDKSLPYYDDFLTFNGWNESYGKISMGNSSMILFSNSKIGSFVFLDGSYLWKDYIFSSTVELTKKQAFSLFARFEDTSNYTACVFAPGSVRIEQMTNGKRALKEEKPIKLLPIGKSFEVGIGVRNNTVDCYVGDSVVLKTKTVKMPLNGGIGFELWDLETESGSLSINDVTVEQL